MRKIEFKYNDGGRFASGFHHHTSDCVTRSLSIALDIEYLKAHEYINNLIQMFGDTTSHVAKGMTMRTTKKLMKHFNLIWIQSNNLLEIPKETKCILNVSRHVCAMVDGVINDTHDFREKSNRIYGYWKLN